MVGLHLPTTSEVPHSATPAPENRLHYPGLDGLRGIAVLMVWFQHYILVSPQYRWGWTGVRIFFVLSGFLITGILYDTRNAQHRWQVFYARRALRIFPLYYGVLLMGTLLYPFFRWVVHPSYILWPLYLQNFSRFLWPNDIPSGVVDHLRATRFHNPPFFLYYGHFWSLAVEEQFYLLWPPLVFAIKRREVLMKLSVFVILLSPVVRMLCSFFLSSTLLSAGFEERFTFLQFDTFLLGALLALWVRGPHPDMTKLARYVLWIFLGIALAAEILCPALYGHALLPDGGSLIFASAGYTCISLASAALVLLAIDPKTFISKMLQNRFLSWLGTISYGFYVLHDLPHGFYEWVVYKLHLADPYKLTTAGVALAGTLILASISFYMYERPFLRLKRRFTVHNAS